MHERCMQKTCECSCHFGDAPVLRTFTGMQYASLDVRQGIALRMAPSLNGYMAWKTYILDALDNMIDEIIKETR